MFNIRGIGFSLYHTSHSLTLKLWASEKLLAGLFPNPWTPETQGIINITTWRCGLLFFSLEHAFLRHSIVCESTLWWWWPRSRFLGTQDHTLDIFRFYSTFLSVNPHVGPCQKPIELLIKYSGVLPPYFWYWLTTIHYWKSYKRTGRT